MKKLFAVAGMTSALVLALAGPVSADTFPAGAEGCIVGTPVDVTGPLGPLTHATSCSYVPTRTAGYVARGTWTLTVEQANGSSTTFTSSSTNAPPQGCTTFSPTGTGAQFTNVVRISVSAPSGSSIAAGNPFPSATDGRTPAVPCR